jgi:large subunit ribosomal protein L24
MQNYKEKSKTNKFKIKIHTGDTVQVTAGKDKGKTGKVEKVFSKKNKVFVSGVNLYKKHRKAQGEGKPGGIIVISRPLPRENVALLCPQCHKPTRIGYQFDKQNKKYRICKKCGGKI